MKQLFILILFSSIISGYVCATERKCHLILQPLWDELQDVKEQTVTFNGKWVRIGTIIFKKKILGPLKVSSLVLSWKGPHIETLESSLYLTEINKPFLAIDDTWISDGQWSSQSQKLTFKFNAPCNLCAITKFHIVVTIPPKLEPLLKKGSFTLSPCTLPQQYQETSEKERILSFQNTPKQTSLA